MKVYHCMNPEENPLPLWMRMPINGQAAKEKEPEPILDVVEQFKQNPDSFFPEFIKARVHE